MLKGYSDGGGFVKKAGKSTSLWQRQNRVGWFFVLPFIIGFLGIYIDVIVNSVSFCFSEVVMSKDGYGLSWVGLKNFKVALLEDANFNRNVVSSFSSVLTSIPTIVIFSLFVAVLLNSKIRGRGFFRALFFLPVIVATGIVTSTEGSYTLSSMVSMTGVSSGVSVSSLFDIEQLTAVLSEVNLSRGVINFIISTITNIYDVVNCSGVQIILFLAGLQSISPSIFEAATMEGASSWEQFWKITFPMLGPLVLVNCIHTAIDRLTTSSNTIMKMVSNSSNTSVNDFGLSAAMSWMYFLLIVVLLLVIVLIGRLTVLRMQE